MVAKDQIFKLGQVHDSQSRLSRARVYVGDLVLQARDFIYKLGLNVKSAAVERVLSAHSWVPTLVRNIQVEYSFVYFAYLSLRILLLRNSEKWG